MPYDGTVIESDTLRILREVHRRYRDPAKWCRGMVDTGGRGCLQMRVVEAVGGCICSDAFVIARLLGQHSMRLFGTGPAVASDHSHARGMAVLDAAIAAEMERVYGLR